MAWWAPWTWFRGNKEEPVEEEQMGLPPEFPEERATYWSWWRPWTWFRRGGEEYEEIEAGPPSGEEGMPEEEPEAYRPAAKRPEIERGRLPTEEEFPELERERPSKKVLIEEELEMFPPEEEEYPGGVYISDRKVQGGFKKFCLALFSIFLLPFILIFGVCLATCIFLLVFPMLMAFFPVLLIGLFMLFIIVPVALPVLIVYLLITERSLLLINSRGHLFSLQGLPTEERKISEE